MTQSPSHTGWLQRLPLILCVAAALSCASAASPVNVEGFELLSVSTEANGGGSCSSGGTALSRGTLFTAAPTGDASYPCCGYTVGLDVSNDLPVQVDSNVPELSVDMHEVILDTLTANYQYIPPPDSPKLKLPDEVLPISAILPSGGGSSSFVAPILSTTQGAVLAGASGELNVTITLSGHTRDGTAVTAAPIQFPIDVADEAPPICTMGQLPAACGVDSYDQADGFTCTG
jgi:hypothetical protein